MIAAGLLGCLALAFFWNRLAEAREEKRLADERRRASMRAVTERWHFREWERDFRSSDSREP